MIHKINNDDSVYVIGQRTKYTKKKLKLTGFWLVGVCILIVGIYLYNMRTITTTSSQGKSLDEVEVISKDAIAPKFMGNQDFGAFLMWIGNHLEYPSGHENEDARVVVAFTISNEGTITDIQILQEPSNPQFGQQVVKLLKQCPRWAPGRLASGKPTDIRYTLPIRFSKTRK